MKLLLPKLLENLTINKSQQVHFFASDCAPHVVHSCRSDLSLVAVSSYTRCSNYLAEIKVGCPPRLCVGLEPKLSDNSWFL